jgi:hypothetical protein
MEDWNNGFKSRGEREVLALTAHHSIIPLFHYSNVLLSMPSAGFDADAADIMAEMEGF